MFAYIIILVLLAVAGALIWQYLREEKKNAQVSRGGGGDGEDSGGDNTDLPKVQ